MSLEKLLDLGLLDAPPTQIDVDDAGLTDEEHELLLRWWETSAIAPTRKKDFDPNQPRADDGKWTSGGGGGGAEGGNGPSVSGANNDEQYLNPADGKYHVKGDVDAAARLISQDKDVVLEQPREVSALLDKLAAIGKDAASNGEKKVYDLCRVSVPGTNLFCSESKGYARVTMPQLAGKPTPGSIADKMPRDAFGGVDVTNNFISDLESRGYSVDRTTEDAGYLRASQRELDGVKVAGIMNAMQSGNFPTTAAPMVVSKDNYIIDGHHRWAAQVALSYASQTKITMPVQRVGIDVVTLLDEARSYAAKVGIPQVAVGKSLRRSGCGCHEKAQPCGCKNVTYAVVRPRRFAAAYRRDFDPGQPRDEDGKWSGSGGGGNSGGGDAQTGPIDISTAPTGGVPVGVPVVLDDRRPFADQGLTRDEFIDKYSVEKINDAVGSDPSMAYRSMSGAEYDATVAAGLGARSDGRWRLPGEKTNFGEDFATALGYQMGGSTDPRDTGDTVRIVEVPRSALEPNPGDRGNFMGEPSDADVRRVWEVVGKNEQLVVTQIERKKKRAAYATARARPGAVYARDFDPDQPRDDRGRWSSGTSISDGGPEIGGGGGGVQSPIGNDSPTVSGAPRFKSRFGGPVDPSVIPRDPKLTGVQKEIETAFANQLAANPDAAWDEYTKLGSTKGGLILSGDDAKDLSPDYRKDKSNSAAVHEPASWFIKEAYAQRLQDPVVEGANDRVVFSAGGTGAGKTTAIQASVQGAFDGAAAVYDTNLNGSPSAWKKIDAALESGRNVNIFYVDRDPEAAWESAMHRAMRIGRTVPMEAHIATHVGARQTVLETMDHYATDSRVTVALVDNNGTGRGTSRVISRSELRQYNYAGLEERLTARLERAHDEGRISDQVYNGMKPRK